MAKKNRAPQEERIQIPIYIPTEDGYGELELGNAEVRGSTLIVNFNDLIPAQAIKHRIERGGIVGLTFVIPAEEGEMHKENEDNIQREQDAHRLLEGLSEADAAEVEAFNQRIQEEVLNGGADDPKD